MKHLVFLLLCSCASLGTSVVPVTDGQEQAVFIAWQSYGRSDMPPLVRWKSGKQLTCDDTKSGKRGFYIPKTSADLPQNQSKLPWPIPDFEIECKEGFTWSPLEILVAWHGEISFSETALAHELLHAALLRKGIWLNHHDLPYFNSMVDNANELIIKAGR
jgi:hypothetical protein